MSPSRLVGSCPTFSPLPRLNGAVILFCVNPAVTDTLHINKRDALCCPDFPHTPRGKRQTVQLLSEREDTTNQPKKQKTFISTSESLTKACFHPTGKAIQRQGIFLHPFCFLWLQTLIFNERRTLSTAHTTYVFALFCRPLEIEIEGEFTECT